MFLYIFLKSSVLCILFFKINILCQKHKICREKSQFSISYHPGMERKVLLSSLLLFLVWTVCFLLKINKRTEVGRKMEMCVWCFGKVLFVYIWPASLYYIELPRFSIAGLLVSRGPWRSFIHNQSHTLFLLFLQDWKTVFTDMCSYGFKRN